ncbi:unnamed protein product [Closterium sp. NIES-53]
MASLRVLAFDHESRPIQFDTWLDDLQLYLLSNIKDGVSLFDHVYGAATAPPTIANGATRSQWLSRNDAARLAIRNHLPSAKCAHFGQHRTAKELYNAVVARYSSPATAALGRLLLPYPFTELSAFVTVEDLVSQLRASDARYPAAVRAEFLDRIPPPMYITLYFIVTPLSDSLCSVRDNFLSLDPTSLTVDLLEQHLLTAETSSVAEGAARGTPRPPFFEGCSPSPLAPSYAYAAAADVPVTKDVGAASASAKRRSSKGKGGRGGGGGTGGGGGGSGSGGGGSSGGGGGGGTVGGSGGSSGGGGGSGGSGGSGSGGTGGGGTSARRVGSGGGQELHFPVLRLHSDRGGEFSSALLGAFCRAQGIRQTFTLPASPQQNGIAERRIGMVMDVARTSMIHAAAPHFLWPFAVQYAAHQLNLQPRVSLPESSPTLLWTGKVGDASAFRVWGSRAFVRDLSADKMSPRATPCVFLGFPPDAPGWQFYHPTSLRVLSSQDVTFDESVPYYRLFPYRTAPLPPPPLFLAPVEPVEVAVDSGAATGAEPAGAGSGGAESGGAKTEGAESRGAETEGAEPGGAEPGGSEPWGAEPGGVETGGAEPGGTEPGGTEPGGAGSARVASRGALSRREVLSPQELREWFARRWGRAAGAGRTTAATGSGGTCTGGAGAAGPGGTAEATGVGPTGVSAERRVPASRPASPARPACTSRRTSRPRPPAVPGTHQMTLRPSTAPLRVLLPSPPVSSLPSLADPESDSLRAASPTVARFLATVVTDPSLASTAASALVAELVDFAARCRLDYAASLVAESASVCPPSVGGECALGTDVLEDRQEEFQCFATALPHLVSTLLAPEGDPDAPDIPPPRSYAEAIEGPYSSQWQAAMDAEMASWKSTGTYVDEVPPPGANIVSGMWIFRVKRPPGSPPVFKAHYVARGFSQRQGFDYFQTFSPTPKMTTLRVLLHVAAQRDYELHSLDFSTAFLQGSLHEEIWLRRPPGFTGSFPPGTQWSLRRPVYGLRQAPREWHDTLRTTLAALGFAPSTADPSLFLRTDTSLPPFYVLVYVDDLVFATADTAGLAHVKSELQKRHTCTDLGELRSYLGLQITRDRAQRTITLTQSHMVQQVLQRFDFTYSLPQASPLSTRHSLSALPSDESVEPSGPYLELVGCLMYLMTCTRPDLAYPLSILARYVAPGRHRPEHMAAAKRVLRYLCSTSGMGLVLGGRRPVVLTGHADASWADDQTTQRSSQGYTFSLGSGSVSWRSTCSSSVLSSSCEAEIYAGAMAAQESSLVLLQTKHIALRYFLARELQQRGQLRLAYMASEANTADIFTKALAPGDHQRFCTMLACFALFDWSCDLLFSPTLPMRSGTLPGTTPAKALHTFTLDSRASRCVFCDSTTLTPLPAPVLVRLADPSGGPVVARSSTVLLCPAVPSDSLSDLHLPSFSTNLVSTAALLDAMVTTTTPGGSSLLLMSPPIAPDSSMAPPPGSPLPATPLWHALSFSGLWSTQVSASPAARLVSFVLAVSRMLAFKHTAGAADIASFGGE